MSKSGKNGIGDQIAQAQSKARLDKISSLMGENPDGVELTDIFSEINFEEVAQEAVRRNEKEELRRQEVSDAVAVATKLVASIAGVEHFFVAGEARFVETVKANMASPPMQKYQAFVALAQAHFTDGSVEENQGRMKIRNVKKHCVVPSRLAGWRELAKLANTRQANGDTLRGLNMGEISSIAVSVGCVAETAEPKGYHVKHGQKFYSLAKNGDADSEQVEEFGRIIGQILNVQKMQIREARHEVRKSLYEQATVSSLEEALENGGIYLANIPSWKGEINGEEKFLPGGEMLLEFTSNAEVIISGEDGEPCADGTRGFVASVEEMRRNEALVSFGEIDALMDKDGSEPTERLPKPSYFLWRMIRRHLDWLFQYRGKKKLIGEMCHDGDLTDEAFLRGDEGSCVLELEQFYSKPAGASQSTVVRPSGIRVSRVLEEGQPALVLKEACPELMPVMACFIGEGKVYPEEKIPGEFGKYVRAWKNFMRNSVTEEPAPAE